MAFPLLADFSTSLPFQRCGFRSCPQDDRKLDDYEPRRTLGTGSFGRVMLVKDTKTSQFCALKILEKAKVCRGKPTEWLRSIISYRLRNQHPISDIALHCRSHHHHFQQVVRLKQVEHTLSEKRILASVDFPFLVNLTASFKYASRPPFNKHCIRPLPPRSPWRGRSLPPGVDFAGNLIRQFSRVRYSRSSGMPATFTW